MSNKIQALTQTGRDAYMVVRNLIIQPFDNVLNVLVAYDDADWADYEIPGVEQGNSGLYEFEFPAELGAESYLVEIRLREVSAPTAALTDKINRLPRVL